MRRPIVAALVAGSLAAGFGIGWFAHQPEQNASAYGEFRLNGVQYHLDEAEPGYVLFAGDSNAELRSPLDDLCGSRIINAGVSGASTPVYRKLLQRLTIRAKPRAAVLTIGTNNLILKKSPRAPETAAKFEDDIAAIVGKLRAATDTVIVTALPPIDRVVGDRLDAAAVGDYSARLAALCPRLGYTYVDPFADLRDGTSGFSKPGVSREAVHLARYKPSLDAIAGVLCPGGASKPVTPPSGGTAAP